MKICKDDALHTQPTLNLRKILVSRSGRHMNVLCPLNLVFLSAGYDQFLFDSYRINWYFFLRYLHLIASTRWLSCVRKFLTIQKLYLCFDTQPNTSNLFPV